MTARASAVAGAPLFSSGIAGPHVDDFRARVRAEIESSVAPLVAGAEAAGRFPRAAVRALGAAGLLRERWSGPGHGDAGRGALLAEELGRAGAGGVGVGVTIHCEAVLSALGRFGASDAARALRERALDGDALGCIAASEPGHGSDLAGVRTSATRVATGWRVRGRKSYVSLGAVADFALALCRVDDPGAGRDGAAPLVLVVVPRTGMEVEAVLPKVGIHSLDTARVRIDATVPDDHLLCRPGLGLAALTWGLTHERFAAAAGVVGALSLAVDLAAGHLHRRSQFGVRLVEHQALRHRVADLSARVSVLRAAVHGVAAAMATPGAVGARDVAALKVVVARDAERVVSECMHVFGGMGYVEDATPLARMWRDVRSARLGGGTDEMMWELVAGGLEPDDDLYDRWVAAPCDS